MEKENLIGKECEDRTTLIVDPSDPFKELLVILERKTRNLEKRKSKGLQLKALDEAGKSLNSDQLASVTQIPGVLLCLEMIHDITSNVNMLRDSYVPPKPCNHTSSPVHRPQTVEKENPTKRVIEVQNSFKKLVENQNEIKDLRSQQPTILSVDEVDLLLSFWNSLGYNNASEPGSRVKKLSNFYNSFITKDNHPISADSPFTFAEIHALYDKIPASVYAVKNKQKTSQFVVVEETEMVKCEVVTKVPLVNGDVINQNSKSSQNSTLSRQQVQEKRIRPTHQRGFGQKGSVLNGPVQEAFSTLTKLPTQVANKSTTITVVDIPIQNVPRQPRPKTNRRNDRTKERRTGPVNEAISA